MPILWPFSRQRLTDFYPTIYQFYSPQTNNLKHLFDRIQSLEAQLGKITTMQDEPLVEAETGHGQFDMFFQMMACLGAGSNDCGGESFSKFHLA